MKVKLNNSIYQNKLLKKGLMMAADNGALFSAGAVLVLSTVARPLSIMATPNTDKENKKIACVKSIASAMAGYLMMLAVSLPLARSIGKINTNPRKYLNLKTMTRLKEKGKPLVESKPYQFATQLFKLGIGFIMVIPKSVMTSALIPPILKGLNKNAKTEQKYKQKEEISKRRERIQRSKRTKNISFSGLYQEGQEVIAQRISKIINKPFLHKIADKYKDSNFVMHIMALTDIVATGTFIHQMNKNKEIEEKRKKIINYNAAIATGLSVAGGYVLDKALEKPTERFIKNFSEANKNSPNLSKYVEGIKIAKPTLILGGIYYIIIPVISTFLADKMDRKRDN